MGLFSRKKSTNGEVIAVSPSCHLDDVVPIGEIVARRRVRVVGEVVRMKTRPAQGVASLAVRIEDETGAATVVFTGRRSIGGVSLGRLLLVEGVAMNRGDTPEFTNPEYTLLPREA
ncbi:MAG TPA: hypothetical protein PKV27_06090, partial [Ilumatobacteraceae bacterium]|nr:hypothetical protein [Ilumatobacteraceae bacterium]